MLIFNGVIHTMDGETIDSGFVQVKGTAIVQVGHMSQLPPGAELDHQVIDARGGHGVFGTSNKPDAPNPQKKETP